MVLSLTPAPASALIYLRGTSSATTSSTSTITISAPTNVTAGDVEVATINAESSSAGFTPPSGWTQIVSQSSPVGWSAAYYHVATSSEPGTYTWQLGSARHTVLRIGDFLGVDNTNPVDVQSTGGGYSGTTATAPSVTTTVANDLIVLGPVADDSSASFSFTAPSGVTDSGGLFSVCCGVIGLDTSYFTEATASATPSKSYGLSASLPWAALTIALKPATGTLAFSTAPVLPSLSSVTLNGRAQNTSAQMGSFGVDDTTSGSGWNVTAAGATGTGKSPVFAQYCPSSGGCGADPQGYVSGGHTLPAGSLTLSSTGASWSTSGGSGAAPTFQCATACAIDSSTATKIASAASGAGLGPWRGSGFGSSSLSLSVPTTTRTLGSGEKYQVDIVFTLSSGP